MKKYNIKVNGISYEVEVEELGSTQAPVSSSVAPTVSPAPVAPAAPVPAAPAPVSSGSAGSLSTTAPMPGTIVKVNVKPGDTVKKGDVFLVLEAMKMENDITAPQDCTVASVNVNQGASVSTGDVLLTYN